MPRKAAFIVVLALAFAAVTGTIALTKTVHLGQAAHKPAVSKRVIATRTAQLNKFEASLRAEMRKKPPAVPKVPPAPAVTPSAAPASAPALASAQRVIYRRPAPIVIHKHRPGGGEHEGSDHGDGGGGGDD